MSVLFCSTYHLSLFSVDTKRIEVWRFVDINAGPRTIPSIECPNEGKVRLTDDSSFVIDTEQKMVTLLHNGLNVDIGERVVYNVN